MFRLSVMRIVAFVAGLVLANGGLFAQMRDLSDKNPWPVADCDLSSEGLTTCGDGATPSPPGSVIVVPDDFPDIQSAIDAAAPGDTISVEPGNYVGSLVVPVGKSFALATERHPDIRLRTSDKKHPTLAGTYLAACTFYAAFFGESPEGLDYDAGLNEATALKLQTVAWQTTNAYYGGNED